MPCLSLLPFSLACAAPVETPRPTWCSHGAPVVFTPPQSRTPQIVHEMEQAGVEPNRHTYTVLLDCLARRRKVFDGFQVMARLVDARVPLLTRGHRAGLAFCNAYGDWRRAMVLMEDMRVAKRRPSGENVAILAGKCVYSTTCSAFAWCCGPLRAVWWGDRPSSRRVTLPLPQRSSRSSDAHLLSRKTSSPSCCLCDHLVCRANPNPRGRLHSGACPSLSHGPAEGGRSLLCTYTHPFVVNFCEPTHAAVLSRPTVAPSRFLRTAIALRGLSGT